MSRSRRGQAPGLLRPRWHRAPRTGTQARFGHGNDGLANVLATLNLMAFARHTALHGLQGGWRQCRGYLETRTRYFGKLRFFTEEFVSATGPACWARCCAGERRRLANGVLAQPERSQHTVTLCDEGQQHRCARCLQIPSKQGVKARHQCPKLSRRHIGTLGQSRPNSADCERRHAFRGTSTKPTAKSGTAECVRVSGQHPARARRTLASGRAPTAVRRPCAT